MNTELEQHNDNAPDIAPAVSDKKHSESFAEALRGWAVAIGIAVLIVAVLRLVFIEPYSIPSESMETTIMTGDRVVVSLLSKDPSRGDIIVFKRPPADPKTRPDDPDVLIKRVIGLPGETVSEQAGKVTVNGAVIEESYLDDFQTTKQIPQPITVPDGELLVMGDNRVNSHDGRMFGTISKDLIVGRAFAVIWPLSHAKSL